MLVLPAPFMLMGIIQDLRQLQEVRFQQSTLWQMVIIDTTFSQNNQAEDALGSVLNTTEQVATMAASQYLNISVLRLLVQSTTIPFDSLTTDTKAGDRRKYYIGYEPSGEVAMTFLETEYFLVYNYLRLWMDEIYDSRKGVWIDGANPHKDAIVTFYATHKGNWGANLEEGLIDQTFYLQGIKPTKIDDLNPNYTTNEGLTVSANFTVERVTDLVGAGESAGISLTGWEWIERVSRLRGLAKYAFAGFGMNRGATL